MARKRDIRRQALRIREWVDWTQDPTVERRESPCHEAGPVQTDQELWRYEEVLRPPYGSQHV